MRGPVLEAVGSDDPDVIERWETARTGVPKQVVREFRPRLERPTSYPSTLPFIPGIQVFVTEMPDRPGETGARWVVEDDSDILADVVAAVMDQGWRESPGRELGFPFSGSRYVFEREGRARLVLRSRLDDGRAVVQLLPLV